MLECNEGQADTQTAVANILCLKNVPPLTCYDLDVYDLIAIIFGTSVTENLGEAKKSDNALFSHLTYLLVLHYLAKQETQNCVFSLKHCMLLCQRTHKTHSNYHLVAAELPFRLHSQSD